MATQNDLFKSYMINGDSRVSFSPPVGSLVQVGHCHRKVDVCIEEEQEQEQDDTVCRGGTDRNKTSMWCFPK